MIDSTLLVGFDFRPASARALGHALAMLRTGCASQLHIAHVVPAERARDEALLHAVPIAIAETATQLAGAAPARPAWAHVRAGDPRAELRRLALQLGADTIVLGTRGGEPGGDDPYAPFSVLVAGDRFELEARQPPKERCAACEGLRRASEVTWPWCRAHRPLGVILPRRLDSSADGAPLGRLLH